MTTTNNSISILIPGQLPDFVKADHPKFKRFVELYYQWLEINNSNGISNTAGNTLYHISNIDNYRDIDETPDEFVRYFKQELLPHFPENTALDLKKILKSAREFYNKKGSEESLRWLFKVLFNEDIEVNYPKEQILIASDGKWIRPKAFRITVNDKNRGIDVNLLEKRQVIGVQSGATCTIESANRTVDSDNGREIIEIYVSNVTRYFDNGELIRVNYEDEFGVARVFEEYVIGTISNIKIDSNIRTDPRQRRRGELYNIGDPVVIYGGLRKTAEANDAAAIVGNVTVGSIDSVSTRFPGYGYRLHPITEVIVYRSIGDDPKANLFTDLQVTLLNLTACTSNSQKNFFETITYDKTAIEFLSNTVIGNANLEVFTLQNKNAVLNVTENDKDDPYNNNEEIWAVGPNYEEAQFKAKIATPNNALFGLGVANTTGDLLVYGIEAADPNNLDTLLSGQEIYTKNTKKSFAYNSLTTYLVPANVDSQLAQCFKFVTENTGGIRLISVLNGGAGFRSPPSVELYSRYDSTFSELYSYNKEADQPLKKQHWQTFKDLGKIAHVYINNPGTGYAANDAITFTGRGYGGNAIISRVNSRGGILSILLLDRGEGYTVRPNVQIASACGTNAVLTAYLFGDGEEHIVETSAIGRIKDLKLIYRGYDYAATPNVSLKMVDAIVNQINVDESVLETEYVYQGDSFEESTFRANVKSYNRETNLLRMYDYSGELNNTVPLLSANAISFTINLSANVPAPTQYPDTVVATGLPNPMFYGNGRAKAKAFFANGLIEFSGFFLNTDGFTSSDKVIQDDKVYHNFSYMVQSERSLYDYENTIKNISHPAGMSLIAKTESKEEINKHPIHYPNVHVIMPGAGGGSVRIANAYSNVVSGFGTLFLPDPSETSNSRVNVGDLIIIDDDTKAFEPIEQGRLPISRIVSAVNSNTELEIEGDFIYVGQGKITSNIDLIETSDANVVSGCTLVTGVNTLYQWANTLSTNNIVRINDEIKEVVWINPSVNNEFMVNSTFGNTATNKTLYKLANTRLVVSGNTNLLSEIVRVGDNVAFNIFSANVMIAQTGSATINTGSNLIIGTGTSFDTQLQINDTIMVANEAKTVLNITNSSIIVVNSNFGSNASGEIVYKRAADQYARVNAVISNYIDINLAYYANLTNSIYHVVPNLNANTQFFRVVTLTSGN